MCDHHAFWARRRSRRVLQERDSASIRRGISPLWRTVRDLVARNHLETRRKGQPSDRLAHRQHSRGIRVSGDCGESLEALRARTRDGTTAAGWKRRHRDDICKQTSKERADEIEPRRVEQQRPRAGPYPQLEKCRDRASAAFKLRVRDRRALPLAILEKRVGARLGLSGRPKAQQLDQRCTHERLAARAISQRRGHRRIRGVSLPSRSQVVRKRVLIRHDEHQSDASRRTCLARAPCARAAARCATLTYR